MTENEFRNALKTQIGQTGLSSHRQHQVLEEMKGGSRKVRTRSKMKIALVVAALVVMTMGAAVATEIANYVNWDGERVDYEEPEYGTRMEAETNPIRDAIVEELKRSKKLEENLLIEYPGYAEKTGHHTGVASLEELQELAAGQTLLPVPISVPEGFTLAASHVFFVPAKGAKYEYLGSETYNAGVRVKRYACDPDDLLFAQYFLYFRDAEGEHLNFYASLYWEQAHPLLETEGGEVTIVSVPGMEQAVCIETEERVTVYMRTPLPEPVEREPVTIGSGVVDPSGNWWRLVTLELQANSTVCDLETMLACFGLTAE